MDATSSMNPPPFAAMSRAWANVSRLQSRIFCLRNMQLPRSKYSREYFMKSWLGSSRDGKKADQTRAVLRVRNVSECSASPLLRKLNEYEKLDFYSTTSTVSHFPKTA